MLQTHRIFDFTVPNKVCNIGHGGQRLYLGSADPLDQLHLFRLRGLLKASQRIVEPVVLAKNNFDRRLAPQEQSHGCEVHLHGQGMLDLLRLVHSFVSLIQELALTGHFGDGLEAHGAHADHQQGDEEIAGEQFRMNRGLDGRNPAHQASQRGACQEKIYDLFLPAGGRRSGDQVAVRKSGFLF